MPNDDATGVLDEEQQTAVGTPEPTAAALAAADEADVEGHVGEGPNPIREDLQDVVPDSQNLDMLLDVSLKVTVEFGRTRLKFRDVLNLSSGSIIELAKQTSEPVDILVNDSLLATGEVVVMDDHFAVRINKLLNRVERLKRIL